MRVLVTGASGYLGTHLCRRLRKEGHELITVARSSGSLLPVADAIHFQADTGKPGPWMESVDDADAVINLAGKPILTRWSPAARRELYASRIATTRNLADAMRSGQVLISASATGIYGDRGDERLDETSPPGIGFLADLCRDWEAAAREAPEGVRVAVTRLGVVLGPGGGALQKMLPVFRAGLGGRLGTGAQWFPWIHLDDVVEALRHLALTPEAEGVFNLVAPDPVTHAAFTRALGAALHRPALVPVPALALKALYGEAATVLLESQRVIPVRLPETGYEYRYPELDRALEHTLKNESIGKQTDHEP